MTRPTVAAANGSARTSPRTTPRPLRRPGPRRRAPAAAEHRRRPVEADHVAGAATAARAAAPSRNRAPSAGAGFAPNDPPPERDVAPPERARVLPVVEGGVVVPALRPSVSQRLPPTRIDRSAADANEAWPRLKGPRHRSSNSGSHSNCSPLSTPPVSSPRARSPPHSAETPARAAANTVPACRARATMRTGASSHSNACSWMIAASDSPMPPVFESSCTMSTRPVCRARVSTASRSSGASQRRSSTLAWIPVAASRSATRVAACT